LQGVQLFYVERHTDSREHQRRHAWQNEVQQSRQKASLLNYGSSMLL
jgi:hypothetical protein